MKLWKVFTKDLKSNYGNIKWKIGKWQKHEGKLQICHSGFHASKRIIDAMQYTPAEVIASVEVKGEHVKEATKECWQEMKIVRTYEWTKEDNVSLAIFAAELVLCNFEKQYPDDSRPRQTIEAAKNWLKEKNKSAAWSASWDAAWSASSAAYAWRVWSAEWDTVRSAKAAADSAGWCAWCACAVADSAAANAASAAVGNAARSAWNAEGNAASAEKILDQCEEFILKRLVRNDSIIGGENDK
jgi:hypothetical protein